MTARGSPSRLNRRIAPNTVTSSGPAQPHNALAGIGGTSRARSASRRAAVPPGAGSTRVSVIEAHRMGCRRPRQPPMAYRGRGMKDSGPGTLTVAATPLGRPADASPRLAAALAAAELIAAEDTRRVLRLARELGVRLTGRMIAYYNGVDAGRAAEFVAALEA